MSNATAVPTLSRRSQLTAKVSTVKGRENSKAKHLTAVGIWADGQYLLGTRTIAGKFSEQQALTEFKRFPKRFKLTDMGQAAAKLELFAL